MLLVVRYNKIKKGFEKKLKGARGNQSTYKIAQALDNQVNSDFFLARTNSYGTTVCVRKEPLNHGSGSARESRPYSAQTIPTKANRKRTASHYLLIEGNHSPSPRDVYRSLFKSTSSSSSFLQPIEAY